VKIVGGGALLASKNPIPVSIKRERYTLRDNILGITGLLKLELKLLTPLHIGLRKFRFIKTKPELIPTIARKPFETAIKEAVNVIEYDYMETVRYGDKICIPGSSVKGVIRSRTELMALSQDNINDFCFIVVTPFRGVPQKGMHGWRHFIIWDPAVYELRDSCNPIQTGDYSLCRGCDIFGAPGVASRVFFGNFCTSNPNVVDYLDLDFGEKLEVIKANTVLAGEISFHGLKLSELGVLLIGLGWCPKINDFKPILMGKSKYRTRIIQNKNIKIILGRAKFTAKSMTILMEYLTPDIRNEVPEIKDEVKGEELKQLFNKAVDKAAKEYPSLAKRICFSEVEVLEECIKKGLIS